MGIAFSEAEIGFSEREISVPEAESGDYKIWTDLSEKETVGFKVEIEGLQI